MEQPKKASGRTPRSNNKTNMVYISVPEDDLTFIKDMVTKTNQKVNEIEKTLELLNHTVVGNAQYGHKGLVKQVEEHTEYIQNDKNYKSKIVGGTMVVALVYGILLKFWDKIF